jgi:TfoX/Sxy family transcriptional regulator of competence genes
MAYDEALAKRIRAVVSDRPAVSEKKMFGGLAFMLNDYMFCGVQQDMLMARIGPDQYANSLKMPFVREMDFTGRPLKGYVYVLPEGIETERDLREWVDLCAEFVLTLPPKKKRRR